jgi:hypothetical protein
MRIHVYSSKEEDTPFPRNLGSGFVMTGYVILMLLDTLRGLGLSSIKNPAIQYPLLPHEPKDLSRHSPEADRSRAKPLFAKGE